MGQPTDAAAGQDLVALVIDAFRAVLPDDEPVDADTDFFEAGGNSVTAARVVARLRGGLDLPLSMRDMFSNRTAGLLAARLGRLSGRAPLDAGGEQPAAGALGVTTDLR